MREGNNLSPIITDQMIASQVEHDLTYQKGLMYWRSSRVRTIVWDKNKTGLTALVLGSRIYNVRIQFFSSGRIESFCSCPAYREYASGCKHIVAVLKTAQQELTAKENKLQQIYHNSQEIFSLFENLPEEKGKDEINLEVSYHLEFSYYKALSSLEMKIGLDRLYVIKNMKDFLEKLAANSVLELGKNFIFSPAKHTFSQENQFLLDLLQEIYEQEKFVEQSLNHSYRVNQTSFKGKKVYLSDRMVKKFFELYQDKDFNGTILDQQINEMRITREELPLNFVLEQEKKQLILHLSNDETILPLTDDGQYFYREKKIHHLSPQQKKYFLPFYKTLRKNSEVGLIFPQDTQERFVSEILPYLKKIGQVSLDHELADNLYQEELAVKIYLDKNSEEEITAQVEFHYGQEMINPFQGQRKNLDGGKILIRDIEKEKRIHQLLEKAQFKVAQGHVILHEEEHIFEFILEILPLLQEEADIYYSDDFKKMQIKDPSAFTGGVRLNDKSNLLEFSFHYPDIQQKELSEIFASLKEKKKFHRLKNGSFLPLNQPELENVAQLLDNLNISEKDLQKEVILLPKYRALYLDSLLREQSLPHLERNLAFKQMVQNIREPEDMEFSLPPTLNSVLRDYQKIGFKWLKTLSHYNLGGILADDMGLGKTLQVLAFLLSEKEKNIGPSLVVAPTSLIYNWQEEAKKFAPDLKTMVISGSQQERQEAILQISSEEDLLITSYPLLRRDIEFYQNFQFPYCFLDEAQQIKNPGTLNAQTVKQIKAQGYFALTGTPMENSLTELWSIFDFLMPGYLLSHNKFEKKYARPIIKNQDQRALKELSRQISPFILRRMKKDVLKELPQKIESKITVEMTEQQKKVYLAYLQKTRGEIAQEIAQQGFEKSQIKILAALTRLRQICCHPRLFLEDYQEESGKISALKEILAESLENGHRILLFSQFTSMLEIIKEMLNQESITHFYLDGSTKAEERGKMVNSFNKGQGQVFLISLKAGGTGLNLTGADMVIHFDPWWNPAVEDQATDRAYRIGQNKVVQVFKLVALGTIEEKIFQLQERKKEMIQSVIQPGENFVSKLTREELESLFEL